MKENVPAQTISWRLNPARYALPAVDRLWSSTFNFLYSTQKCNQINLNFKRWKHLCKNCEWGSFGVRYRKALNGLERNNEKMSVGLNDHGHFCLPHQFSSIFFVFVVIERVNIPHICHFFTQAKFLENKIYTEIYTLNCLFSQ